MARTAAGSQSPKPRFTPHSPAPNVPGFSLEGGDSVVVDLERTRLATVFAEMDRTCSGKVSLAEFHEYVLHNPRAWPLADHLVGVRDDIKAAFIKYWFRRLDVSREGAFNEAELVALFTALCNKSYKEACYADLFLDLFDTNYDKRLDRKEYTQMLRMVLGREPPTSAVARVGPDGITRHELIQLLHSVDCNFQELARDTATGTAVIVSLVAVVAVGIGLVYALRHAPRIHHH